LSNKFDTEESWENNYKMSDKMVLARVEGSALGFCQDITDNKLNCALVVDIVTKKEQRSLYMKKDNLEDLKKAKFAERLLISFVEMMDLSWDDAQGEELVTKIINLPEHHDRKLNMSAVDIFTN
jgi:hypothetical protein